MLIYTRMMTGVQRENFYRIVNIEDRNEFLADFNSIYWYAVCNVKIANFWHDWYALTTTKEACTILFNSQNI